MIFLVLFSIHITYPIYSYLNYLRNFDKTKCYEIVVRVSVPISHVISSQDHNKNSHLSVNPFMCKIFICLMMVVFPDSPVPRSRILFTSLNFFSTILEFFFLESLLDKFWENRNIFVAFVVFRWVHIGKIDIPFVLILIMETG